MTTITGNPRQRQTDGDTFDALISPDRARVADARVERRTAIDELLLAEPSVPRASLKTVAMIFLAIAATQVGVLAVSAVSFELPIIRLVLALTVVAPATLYTIVAAWDHRQLTASGHTSATRWEWAFVFPPAYLALRFLHVRESRRDIVAAIAWAIAQLLVTVAFIVFAVSALVTSPQQAAGAASVDDLGDITASTIAAQVEQGWADAGGSGTVACPEPASQEPGTTIACTAEYEATPLVFTAAIGDTAAGEAPIVIASWSEVASE